MATAEAPSTNIEMQDLAEDSYGSKADTDNGMFYFDLSWQKTRDKDYLLFGIAVICLSLVSGAGNYSYSPSDILGSQTIFIFFLMAGLIGGKLMEDQRGQADQDTGLMEDHRGQADQDTGLMEDHRGQADQDTGLMEDHRGQADQNTGLQDIANA